MKICFQKTECSCEIKKFVGFWRKALIYSFILSNFNYCHLVWFISSDKCLNKVENLQKRALQFLFNDYSSSYEELIKNSETSTVNVSNYCSLCIEIFKTLNDINPSFIKYTFKLRMTNSWTQEKYKLNLEIPKSNQARFGTKSLEYLGPKVWNSLPCHIKSSENLTISKTLKKIGVEQFALARYAKSETIHSLHLFCHSN